MKLTQSMITNGSAKGPKRFKVLHLIASPKIGGAEKLLLTVADNIDAERFDVSIAVFIDSRKKHNAFFDEAKGCKVRLYPVDIKGPYDVRQLIQIYRIIATFKPDVIHTHGYKTNILGFLMARCFMIPIIATVHGWLHSTRRTTQLYNRVNLFLLRRFDQVIAVSCQIETVLLQLNVSTSRLITLRNVPAAPKRFEINTAALVERFSLDPKARYVGFVGRLEPVKGGEFLISAAVKVLERYPNVQFLIAGEGSELSRLEAMVAEVGLSRRVRFLGFLARPGDIFQLLDLYVLPSLDEGIPLSLLEAMAAEVPVVASSVGGVPEVIEDGINGLLVPPGETELLAEAICHALNDRAGGVQRIEAARKTIDEKFNILSWIESLQALYVNLKT